MVYYFLYFFLINYIRTVLENLHRKSHGLITTGTCNLFTVHFWLYSVSSLLDESDRSLVSQLQSKRCALDILLV
jgi:hypothetical protein